MLDSSVLLIDASLKIQYKKIHNHTILIVQNIYSLKSKQA